ncbi:MAG: hypothetical protein ACK4M6_11865 [Hyphomonas sp.]
MKKLLASCAVVALMAAPALAQSTIDPTTPDAIPVEPMTTETTDPMNEFQPQTEVLPQELPPEPDMAEEVAPPTPGVDATMQAEAEAEDESFAETEDNASFADAEADMTVTAEVVAPEVALEASVSEADLPEEYSTDDLNANMLAAVNTVGTEITELDAQADVWVTADGSPVDPTYAPEGQGDLDIMSEEEAPVTDGEVYMTPEAEAPESSSFIEPGLDPVPEDTWNNEAPVSSEDAPETEY